MNNKKNTSFTLIELLVVIVIIGVLAGVIMVTTSSSVSSANLARAKAFSSNVQNSMLLNLVSEWTFDDSSAYGDDSWGVNNGTLHGTIPGTDCVFGKCLNFNGSTDYIDCTNGNDLNLIGEFSIGIWAKSTKNNASLFQGIIGKANLNGSEFGWIVSKGTDNKFYFQVRTNTSGSARTDLSTYSDRTYIDNGWHYMVGVLEDNGSHSLYIDGIKQVAFNSSTSWLPAISSIKLVVGTAYGDLPLLDGYNERFGGLIDEVRLYKAALSSAQIKQNYIAGLNSMLANGNISEQEYNQRINNLAQK